MKAPSPIQWFQLFLIVVCFSLTAYAIQAGFAAHAAVCALAKDLDDRATETDNFLKENPLGIRGVPVETLRNSAMNQHKTSKVIYKKGDC